MTARKVNIIENNIHTSISFTSAVWGRESLIPVKLKIIYLFFPILSLLRAEGRPRVSTYKVVRTRRMVRLTVTTMSMYSPEYMITAWL